METIIGKRPAFRNLEVDKIKLPDPDLRSEISEEEIDQLGDSMKDVGPLQPILVSVDAKAKEYRIIIGGRRLRAAKKKKMPTIPAYIVDEMKGDQTLAVKLIENMQRSDLEPLEEARGMAELRDTFKYSEEKIAQTIGKREQFVRDRLSLLGLPRPVLKQVESGTLNVSQATSIAKLEGKEMTQLQMAAKAIERQLPAQIVSRMVDEVLRAKRSHKKMTRKHKLKKRGEALSEEHMQKKLLQVTVRGEQFLKMLGAIPLKRWSPDQAEKLSRAIDAIEQGLNRFKQKTVRRSKESDDE